MVKACARKPLEPARFARKNLVLLRTSNDSAQKRVRGVPKAVRFTCRSMAFIKSGAWVPTPRLLPAGWAPGWRLPAAGAMGRVEHCSGISSFLLSKCSGKDSLIHPHPPIVRAPKASQTCLPSRASLAHHPWRPALRSWQIVYRWWAKSFPRVPQCRRTVLGVVWDIKTSNDAYRPGQHNECNHLAVPKQWYLL